MRNFNRGNRSSGNRDGGRFNSNPNQMFKAVCDECGESCEVPFRPSGNKPIFCSNCFSKKNAGNSGGGNRRDFGKRDSNRGEMFKAVCDECGQACEVPFRPNGNKPIYCDACFGNKRSHSTGGSRNSNDQSGKALNDISVKLDKILQLLTGQNVKQEVAKKDTKEKEAKPSKEEKPTEIKSEKKDEPKKDVKKVTKKVADKKKSTGKKVSKKKVVAKKVKAKKTKK